MAFGLRLLPRSALVTLTGVWPIAAVALAGYAQTLVHGLNGLAHTAIGAGLFLALVSIDPLALKHSPTRFERMPAYSDGAILGAVLVAALIFFFRGSLVHTFSLVTSVLIVAGIEEWIFRRELPRRLLSAWSNLRNPPIGAQFASCILAQAIFAACHVVTSRTVSLAAIVGIFAAGVFYAGIVATRGIGVATAVHGLLNLSLFESLEFGLPDARLSLVTAGAVAGCLSLWAVYSTPVCEGSGRA